MNHPPITLPDDPKLALQEIASYIRSVRDGRDRAHYEKLGPEGLGKELVGYWQTPEWIEGLKQCAAEAELYRRVEGMSFPADQGARRRGRSQRHIEIAVDPKTKEVATSFTATLNQSAS